LVNGIFIVLGYFVFYLFIIQRVPHIVGISFETIFCLYLLSLFLIFCFKSFCICHHFINFLFGKSAFIISNSDAPTLASGLVNRSHIHNSISINIIRYFNLRHTPRGRGNPV